MKDIPNLDESITRLDTQMIEDLAETGRNSLFFFSKAILQYRDLAEGCHGPLCEYLDRNPSRFRLVLMPRGHFKTTIGTIARSLQMLTRNAEQRILIANESATNAERFLSTIQSHAEQNRVFRALYSDLIPPDFRKVRWNKSEAEFQREGVYPEPSIDTIGMTGAFTSRHYTHIIYDDPISLEAVKSPSVMQDTIIRCHQALSLFTNTEKDTFDLIGTRWALADLYSDFEEKFGSELARFSRSVVEDGKIIFPERVSWKTISQLRRSYGEYLFSCLYMNNPRNEEIQTLNTNALREWRETNTGQYVLLKGADVHTTTDPDRLDITVTVDLAAAETATSDRNAITVCGTTPEGDVLVLWRNASRCTPLELMEKLFALDMRFHPRVIGIEDIGYQKAFKVFLRNEMARRQHWLTIRPIKAPGKKEWRIKGLQPMIESGHLYLAPGMQDLIQEMADFPLGKHDDLVDSLSMHNQIMLPHAGIARWGALKRKQDEIVQQVRKDMGLTLDDETSEDDEPDHHIQEAMFV